MGTRHPDTPPLTVTDQYLAAILDELRTISTRLVQEPQEPEPGAARLVSEPDPRSAPGRAPGRPEE